MSVKNVQKRIWNFFFILIFYMRKKNLAFFHKNDKLTCLTVHEAGFPNCLKYQIFRKMGIKWRKNYIEGSSINLEENTMIEFKNHRSISFEEVPPDKIGIQPVSNTICGFLNQGKGKNHQFFLVLVFEQVKIQIYISFFFFSSLQDYDFLNRGYRIPRNTR